MVVVPSHPRDNQFHHLAVRFPFKGEESNSSRFRQNTANIESIITRYGTDQFWMVGRLGENVWLARAINEQDKNYRLGQLKVVKRVVVDGFEGWEKDRTAIIHEQKAIPDFLRFSTLEDPGLFSWCNGSYLPKEMPWFPRLECFSYHPMRFPFGVELDKREYGDQPHMCFSGVFEYFNGGTLDGLMRIRDKKYRDRCSRNQQEVWVPERLPEPLIWHIINQIARAIIELHSTRNRELAIIHGRIDPRNIYFHFDEAGLLSEDEVEKANAHCFPRVVLGRFDSATFEDNKAENPMEQYLEDKAHWPDTKDEVYVLKRKWWDAYFFGLLIRKMMLFGDTGIIHKRPDNNEYPKYFNEGRLGIMRWSVARYLKSSEMYANDPEHSFYNPGFRPWSQELYAAADRFDRYLRRDQDKADRELSGLHHWVDLDIRPHHYEAFNYIKESILPYSEWYVGELKKKTIQELDEIDNGRCDLVPEIGPEGDVMGSADTMLYRTKRELNVFYPEIGDRVHNAQDAIEADMKGFPGPWSYLSVKYDSYSILVDGYEPDKIRFKDMPNGVLPFGHLPNIGERRPGESGDEDGDEDDDEDQGRYRRLRDPEGQIVQEKLFRRHVREAAKQEVFGNLVGYHQQNQHDCLTLEQDTVGDEEQRRVLEEGQFQREEEQFELMRKQVQFDNRGDILHEAHNAIIRQGDGMDDNNKDRGFWERWREESVDSVQFP